MTALAPQDTLFLTLENARLPMNVAGLQLHSWPEGSGDLNSVIETLRRSDLASPPFNQRPQRSGFRWHWTEQQHLDLDYHLRHITLPAPGTESQLHRLVANLHAQALDRDRPLWTITIIDGLADGRFATYVKFHHAQFDGMAALNVCRTAFSTDQSTWPRTPFWQQTPEAPPARGAHRQSGPLEDRLRIMSGVTRGLRDLLLRRADAHDHSSAKPYQAPPTPLNVRVSGAIEFAAHSFDLERLHAIADIAQCTVNDVVLAMCATALRRYLLSTGALPAEALTALVPVSVRTANGPVAGNWLAAMLVNLGTQMDDPVRRLHDIAKGTRRSKEDLKDMSRLEQIAWTATALGPAPITTRLGLDRWHPPFNVVISNLPGPRERQWWYGSAVEEMIPVSLLVDGQALNITLASYANRMAFGFTACARAIPDLERLVSLTSEALDELETHLLTSSSVTPIRAA